MKAVKSVSIFFLITCCCISCTTIVHETLQIAIQNRTDDNLHITLYPKGDIGGLYPECEGCGGHRDTQFVLPPNNDGRNDLNDVIFYTVDLEIAPGTLASQAFDSIYIRTANEDSVIIKFTHEKVTGYSENLFSDNSTWDFEVVE